jgi:hypothetical protein
LLIPIPDPELIWKEDQAEIKRKQEEEAQAKSEQEEEKEIAFVTDTVGDTSLQPHYIEFDPENFNIDVNIDESDDSDTSGLGDSDLYNSDIDYS